MDGWMDGWMECCHKEQLTRCLELLWVVDPPVAVQVIVPGLVPQGQVVVGSLHLKSQGCKLMPIHLIEEEKNWTSAILMLVAPGGIMARSL